MDIHPKNFFLFDGLDIEGFKFFIVNNNQKVIEKLLYAFKQIFLIKNFRKNMTCQFFILGIKDIKMNNRVFVLSFLLVKSI